MHADVATMLSAMSTGDWIWLAVFLFGSIWLVAFLSFVFFRLFQTAYSRLRGGEAPPVSLAVIVGSVSVIASLCFLGTTATYSFRSLIGARPELDSTPVSAPEPLLTVRDCDPKELLPLFAAALQTQDFSPVVRDRDFRIEAKRPTNRNKGYDSVILWFARDVEDPSHLILVFLLHERFEKVLSAKTGIYRVKLDEDERWHVSKTIETALRQALGTRTAEQ